MRLFIALWCCIALSAQAEIFSAKVIVVMDGDTVMVLREDGSEAAGLHLERQLAVPPIRSVQKIKVRLANIDAPEKEQSFGKQSRDSLLELVGKKQVQIDSQAVDQYGRIVGLILLDGRNINQEQVKRGMAWAATGWRESRLTVPGLPAGRESGSIPPAESSNSYLVLQNRAQQERRGLWAQTDPQAPWQWRREHLMLPTGDSGRRKPHHSIKPVPQANKHSAVSRVSPAEWYGMECGKKHLCSQMSSCDEASFYLMQCGELSLDGNRDGEPCENLCSSEKK